MAPPATQDAQSIVMTAFDNIEGPQPMGSLPNCRARCCADSQAPAFVPRLAQSRGNQAGKTLGSFAGTAAGMGNLAGIVLGRFVLASSGFVDGSELLDKSPAAPSSSSCCGASWGRGRFRCGNLST